jgi:ribosome-associated toxin RatA of RatAB toxin-antitoxin module
MHVALTTRNTLTPGERIEMALSDGPFAHFRGDWRFLAIRDPGGALHGCRVELLIEFRFRNPALGLIAGHAFERSWDALVDAFVRRARELYGD